MPLTSCIISKNTDLRKRFGSLIQGCRHYTRLPLFMAFDNVKLLCLERMGWKIDWRMPIFSFTHRCCSPFRLYDSLTKFPLLLLFTIKIYTRPMPFSQLDFRLEIDRRWDLPFLWFTDTRNLTDVEMPWHRDFLILTTWLRQQKGKKTNRFGGTNSNNNLMVAVGDFWFYIGIENAVYSFQEPFDSGNEQKRFFFYRFCCFEMENE